MTKKHNKRIALLGAVAVICFAIAGIFLCLPLLNKTAVASTYSGNTKVTATELTYNGENRSDDDGNAGTNSIADRGLIVYTSTSSTVGTGSTLTVPSDVKGKISVKMNTQINKSNQWGTSFAEFRLVLNNTVLFPVDGGWFDLYEYISDTSDGTDAVTGGKLMSGLAAFDMQAGDKLHFIFRDKNGISNWGNYYCTFGMTINGVWFDATSANYINPENDTATSSYFGGTYNYSDFWSYNQYTWHDYEVASIGIDGYESAVLQNNATSSRIYTSNAISDMSGTEYFYFNVKNSSDTAQTLWMNYYEGPHTGDYGQTWTTAEYNYYYLYSEGETTKEQMPAAFMYNNSKMSIPAGFEGVIYLPVESLEENGWTRSYERNGKFNDKDTLYLKNAFIDLSSSSWSDVTVSVFGIMGADLTQVTDTYDTAINLIKKIGTVTLASENAIANARACYDALSETARANVTNYASLTAAEETFASLGKVDSNVSTHGKNFTGTEGVTLSSVYAQSPSTFSAYVKVARDYDDVNGVGTVLGNKEVVLNGQSLQEGYNCFAIEVTSDGCPKFVWRYSKENKVEWTVKNADLRNGKWTNLAFTRNAQSGLISCYINGELVDTLQVSSSAIGDLTFIKPVKIGSTYTADSVLAYGYKPDFKGQIANVRVYSDVLDAEEIKTNLTAIVANNGLMTAIDFASGETGNYYDFAVNSYATDGFEWAGSSSNLKLGDYTMAVLGDTQMHLSVATDGNGLSLYDEGYDYTSNAFYKNIQWLIANKDALNLQFVMHMGDLTDNLNNNVSASNGVNKGNKEMDYAMQFMDYLTEAGIPWSLNRGNHDSRDYWYQSYNYSEYGETYEENFTGVEFGAYSEDDMCNTYYKFNVNGLKYMIVSLNLIPSLAEMEWANDIISANPDRLVIVTTHAYVGHSGGYASDVMNLTNEYSNLEAVWTNLVSKHKNIFMTVCGHESGTDIIRMDSVGDNGNPVYQFMIDESQLEYAGHHAVAPFAILGFDNGGSTVHFNYYSATDNKLFRDWNQFTIELDIKDYLDVSAYDDYTGDDAETVKSEYATYIANQSAVIKNNLIDLENLTVNEYAYMFENGVDIRLYPSRELYGEDGAIGGTLNLNGAYMRFSSTNCESQEYVSVYAFDVDKNGVLQFGNDAYVKITNSAWVHFGAYIIDGATNTTKRLLPVTSQASESFGSGSYGIVQYNGNYEYLMKGAQTVYWNGLLPSGVRVNAGDKILFYVRGGGTSVYNKLNLNITEADGTVTVYDAISGVSCSGQTATKDIMKALYQAGYGKTDADGSPVNVNGWTVGFAKTVNKNSYTPYNYTLTVNDEDGNLISAKKSNFYVTVPNLERSGKVFLGYVVDGVLYAPNSVITLTANTTATAIFTEFATYNGASVRIGDYGMRFSTYLDRTSARLEELGITVSFGTLIAPAYEITEGGVKNYSELTLEYDGKMINLPSTVQVALSKYTVINASAVSLNQNQLELQLVARGYMTVSYADGSQKVFYASVTDNGRSIKEIAALALADVSKVETEEYKYATDGGYSAYDQTARDYLNSLIAG